MAQITTGVRAILSSPGIYDALQNIMGARRVRQELVDVFIRPEEGSRILDLGCGTAEILKYLPDTVEYWGYDISAEYIAAAKAEYGEHAHFHCGLLGDADLDALPRFDRVLALGVLHHLNDNGARTFFALAEKALAPNGRVITIDPCLADGQNPVARYLVLKDRGQNVRDADAYALLAKDSFRNIKGALRHRMWIPYTHWIMECNK